MLVSELNSISSSTLDTTSLVVLCKRRTAYEMRISDWSSDVCSSDLKFPGARHSLDALCNRFGVDTSSRTKHGALIDTHILKDLYLAWFGQGGFDLEATISIVAKEEISNLGALNSILVAARGEGDPAPVRSEEHTSELQSLTRIP